MVNVDNLLVFSSILFLIVIELSGRFRDLDLGEIARQKEGYVLFLPNLGILTYIHGLNAFLLLSGYLLALTANFSGSYVSMILLWAIYTILLVILPHLEIEDYDGLLGKSEQPTSFRIHLVFTSLVVILLPILVIIFGFFSGTAGEKLDKSSALSSLPSEYLESHFSSSGN